MLVGLDGLHVTCFVFDRDVGLLTVYVESPPALLTTRACWWAINQMRREQASIRGLARQLGTTWNTVWTSIEPLLKEMADDGPGLPASRGSA